MATVAAQENFQRTTGKILEPDGDKEEEEEEEDNENLDPEDKAASQEENNHQVQENMPYQQIVKHILK